MKITSISKALVLTAVFAGMPLCAADASAGADAGNQNSKKETSSVNKTEGGKQNSNVTPSGENKQTPKVKDSKQDQKSDKVGVLSQLYTRAKTTATGAKKSTVEQISDLFAFIKTGENANERRLVAYADIAVRIGGIFAVLYTAKQVVNAIKEKYNEYCESEQRRENRRRAPVVRATIQS